MSRDNSLSDSPELVAAVETFLCPMKTEAFSRSNGSAAVPANGFPRQEFFFRLH